LEKFRRQPIQRTVSEYATRLGVAVSKTLRLPYLNSIPKRAAVPSTISAGTECPAPTILAATDDLSRNVFGLLGLPIDAIGFSTLLQSMETPVGDAAPFLISTPNVNFLVKSQQNSEFRESILLSDLCLVDGMPLIWIAKLLQIRIHERIAGSDLFGRLKSTNGRIRRLKVFLLGGAEGTAATVSEKLNAQRCGLECVGVLNPGFGTIEQMSTPEIIDTINASRADLLAVFFGAEKAQAWLMHNHRRLRVPIRAQFGATINFEAGTVKRAPHFIRSTGFEWLWRIKEEPYLWRRYWNDGVALFHMLATSVLPLMVDARRKRGRKADDLFVSLKEDNTSITLALSGPAITLHADKAVQHFRNALNTKKQITVDISNTSSVDSRFFGLFLMVRKQLATQGKQLRFTGISPRVRRIFRLNRFEFLLSHEV
jgi:N-acetylglucosaminyldiphosphoundecaprenol N-acetyl-beta-D-mannosaminyltransferase